MRQKSKRELPEKLPNQETHFTEKHPLQNSSLLYIHKALNVPKSLPETTRTHPLHSDFRIVSELCTSIQIHHKPERTKYRKQTHLLFKDKTIFRTLNVYRCTHSAVSSRFFINNKTNPDYTHLYLHTESISDRSHPSQNLCCKLNKVCPKTH